MIKKFASKFTVKLCCRILEVQRSTYYSALKGKISLTQKYKHLKEIICEIIEDNPGYGYRRIQDALKNEKGIIINHKPLRKLLKLWHLSLKRKIRKPKRGGIDQILDELGETANLLLTLCPEEIQPLKVIRADFTEINTQAGKVYLITCIDHKTKVITGASIADGPNAQAALEAFQETEQFLKEQNINLEEVIIHQDQGSAFKSYLYVDEVTKSEAALSYSRKGKFQDNSVKEAFFSQFKNDWLDIFQTAKDKFELKEMIQEALRYYNHDRIHSKCNGLSPLKHLSTIKIN